MAVIISAHSVPSPLLVAARAVPQLRKLSLKRTKLQDAGAQEIVLTGVNIGDFGKAHGSTFLELVQALDEQIDIPRFRISSIEPNLLNDEIIDFVSQSQRFQPHFHIPLQSGSDAMLQSMRRRYRTAEYVQRIERIRERMPLASIGVDVITGFHGEKDEHFKETQDFLMRLPISYLHVFTYSERAKTTALRLENVVPVALRKGTHTATTDAVAKEAACTLRAIYWPEPPRFV